MTRALLLTVGTALLVLSGPGFSGADAAGPVVVTPDVGNLPVGGAPALPYLDVPRQQIVDGARRVSVAGLKATVVRLFKVDGGYVLGRTFPGGSDLVYVTSTGARSVITGAWVNPGEGNLDPGVMVSTSGGRIVFNTTVRSGRLDYGSTVTMALPGRTVLHRRTFSEQPKLLAFDGRKALLSVGRQRVVWWTPGTTAVVTVADKVAAEAADLSAAEYAVRHGNDYRVQGLPPAATPDWGVAAEDWELGTWSPDDALLAGTGEVLRGTPDVEVYHVVQAADGVERLTVRVLGYPQITWEDDTHMLIRTGDSDAALHQLVRCSLAGDCERVGGTSTSNVAPYVVATRRNS